MRAEIIATHFLYLQRYPLTITMKKQSPASLLSNMTCRRHCDSAPITQHGPWLQTVSQPVGEEDLFTMMAKAKGAG